MAERPDEARAVPIGPERKVPVGPGETVVSSFDPHRLDFGHHAGRTIAELAVTDPDYLRWLMRHPSGARYRAEISRVMEVIPRLEA